MEKNNKSNIIIAVIFLVYIFLTCLFTIKNNYLELRKDLRTAIKTEKDLKMIDRVINLRDRVESVFANKIALKYDYIDIYGLVQQVQGKKIISDVGEGMDVVKLSDGSLAFIYPDRDVTDWINKVTETSNYATKKGIYFSYVMAPWRINENAKLPFYLEDYAGDVSKRLLSGLENNNINTIDLEKRIEIDKKSWFFASDHHWTIKAAFNSYQIIAKQLDKDVGINLEYDKLTDFSIEKYPHSFLGSYGKRTGKYYSKVDSFDYIYPNYDTLLNVSNNDWDKEVSNLTGTFENTLIYKDFLNLNADTGRETSVYYTYTNGGKASIKIKNHNANNNKKLLVLKDSFAEPVFAFLSLNFNETRAIDIRSIKNINLKEYIDSYKPDIILFIYNPSSIYDVTFVNYKWE